jgi:hypothetical protein
LVTKNTMFRYIQHYRAMRREKKMTLKQSIAENSFSPKSLPLTCPTCSASNMKLYADERIKCSNSKCTVVVEASELLSSLLTTENIEIPYLLSILISHQNANRNYIDDKFCNKSPMYVMMRYAIIARLIQQAHKVTCISFYKPHSIHTGIDAKVMKQALTAGLSKVDADDWVVTMNYFSAEFHDDFAEYFPD